MRRRGKASGRVGERPGGWNGTLEWAIGMGRWNGRFRRKLRGGVGRRGLSSSFDLLVKRSKERAVGGASAPGPHPVIRVHPSPSESIRVHPSPSGLRAAQGADPSQIRVMAAATLRRAAARTAGPAPGHAPPIRVHPSPSDAPQAPFALPPSNLSPIAVAQSLFWHSRHTPKKANTTTGQKWSNTIGQTKVVKHNHSRHTPQKRPTPRRLPRPNSPPPPKADSHRTGQNEAIK